MNYTIFDFSRFTDLEYLDIGDNSFRSVDTFIIDGMHNLTTLIIGKKSFLSVRYYDGWNPGTSFHIKNCELLKSIEIGKNSFTDYTGIFELINLPSLQTVNIGDMIDDGIQECNFFYSSFVIRGNYLIMIGNLFRSPEITIYWSRCECILFCRYDHYWKYLIYVLITELDLPLLQSIKLGQYTLNESPQLKMLSLS